MADREDTAVHAMKPAADQAVVDRGVTETQAPELRPCDHSVLAGCKFRHPPVEWLDRPRHGPFWRTLSLHHKEK